MSEIELGQIDEEIEMARTKRRIDQLALMFLCRCKLQAEKFRRRKIETVPRKTIYVHIGTHKTGTTSIQSFLRQKSVQLKRCGILVPRSGTLSWAGGHHNLSWEIRGDRRFEPQSGGVDDLIVELRAARESVAVISSEDFEYIGQYHDKLRLFHAKLIGAGFDPVYVVFFRNKIGYMKSLCAELKKHGIDRPLEWFEAEVAVKGAVTVYGDWRYEFDYDRFLAQWKEVVGDAVFAFSYDAVSTDPGLLPFFFETIGAPPDLVAASVGGPMLNIGTANRADVGLGG